MTQVGLPVGLRFNGETVTREVAGDSTDTQWQTALVDRQSVERNRERGDQQNYDLQMQLATTDAVLIDDTYLITEDGTTDNGQERCSVVDIGKAEHGLRMVKLKRIEATVFTGGARR